MSTQQDRFGWLLAQFERDDLTDLEFALALVIDPPETPRERRARELGPLAILLEELPPKPGLGFPLPKRRQYDSRRPGGALRSATLVRLYGSWHAACSAAYKVHADGRYDKNARHWQRSQPWPSWTRGRPGITPYKRDEVLSSIRRCGEAIGRRPPYKVYLRWSAAEHRRARLAGRCCRTPGHGPIYRFFPASAGGWKAAVSAAYDSCGETDA